MWAGDYSFSFYSWFVVLAEFSFWVCYLQARNHLPNKMIGLHFIMGHVMSMVSIVSMGPIFMNLSENYRALIFIAYEYVQITIMTILVFYLNRKQSTNQEATTQKSD